MRCPFRGSLVALPTPFRGGELDLNALRRLVDFHVRSGSDGLVVNGTSGEASTLTRRERGAVIAAAVERAAGRLPVIAGVGTNATAESIELARAAELAGADGLLVVTPYYNRPTPDGLLLHFGAVAESTRLPVVLYNVPSRTGCDLRPETAAELFRRHANVVAVKEANGSVGRARAHLAMSRIAVFSGEDGLVAEYVAAGAAGTISVVANVAPAEVAELCRVAVRGGDPSRTMELVAFLRPIVRALFVESNPAPMKAALAGMGLCEAEVRLPLAPLRPESRAVVARALEEAGLAGERVAVVASTGR